MGLKSKVGPFATPPSGRSAGADCSSPSTGYQIPHRESGRLTFAYPEHLCAALRTDALSCRTPIFERSCLGVFNLPLGPALETVRLRSHASPPPPPEPCGNNLGGNNLGGNNLGCTPESLGNLLGVPSRVKSSREIVTENDPKTGQKFNDIRHISASGRWNPSDQLEPVRSTGLRPGLSPCPVSTTVRKGQKSRSL